MKNPALVPILLILVVLSIIAFAHSKYSEQGLMIDLVKSQFEKDQLQTDVAELDRQLTDLRTYINEYNYYLEGDSKFWLYLVDRDLEALARGEKTRGSFYGYFVPNLAQAVGAGATKQDIKVRVDRLISLANKGVCSLEIKDVMAGGGSSAIRSYIDEWIVWGPNNQVSDQSNQ